MINLELIFIFLYIIIVVSIGFFVKKSRSSEGFLIGNRKIEKFGTIMSIFATLITESIVFFAIALTVAYGPYGVIAAMLGPSLALITMSFFAEKAHSKALKNKFVSISEYCVNRWGNVFGKISRIIFLVMLFWVIILQINLNGNLFAGLLDWNLLSSTIIVIVIVSTYLLIGGYKAVIQTDIFQGLFLLMILLLPFFMIQSPDLSIVFNSGGLSINAFLLFLMSFSLTITRPEMWQRVYSAKSGKVAKKSLLIVSLIHFIFGIFILYYAFAVVQATPGLSGIEAFATGYKTILPFFIASLFPTILLAAMMSSLDSATFLFSADLSKIKKFSNKRIFWTKSILLISLLIAGVLSLTVFDALSFAYTINGLVALLTIPILISFWRKIPKKILTIGFIIGFIIYSLQVAYGRIAANSSEAILPALVTGAIIFVGVLFKRKN